MRLLPLGLVLLCASIASAAPKQHRYVGIHPVAKTDGGGFCYIEGAHVHIYAADKVQYRDHRGHQHFVGDPVAYGYDGPTHVYQGHHPIQVDVVVGDTFPDVEFCYLDGPHYHYFVPPDGPDFKVVGDAYFFVGEPPRAYIEARPAMVQINAVYRPLVYARPVIVVEAPVGWIGARAEFITPVVVAPAATVVAPGVAIDARVVVPMPSVRVDIGIGVPGVVVEGRYKVKHKGHKHRGRW